MKNSFIQHNEVLVHIMKILLTNKLLRLGFVCTKGFPITGFLLTLIFFLLVLQPYLYTRLKQSPY